ncbi:unnamed protein product [Fraxinus pennsylvanica]|uniref:Uncharacterized protein n=1 Tax=Fraxinus pennsylvanica TaxID=56036 RepID=A0AAD1YPA7_9LAMI|nr:unnamed protein product [Fraxinus pennsylvanica]
MEDFSSFPMEKSSRIIRRSIFTFLQNYQFFTSTVAIVAFPFAASTLVCQASLPSSSIFALVHGRLRTLFLAAGALPISFSTRDSYLLGNSCQCLRLMQLGNRVVRSGEARGIYNDSQGLSSDPGSNCNSVVIGPAFQYSHGFRRSFVSIPRYTVVGCVFFKSCRTELQIDHENLFSEIKENSPMPFILHSKSVNKVGKGDCVVLIPES